ncbi:hypothetical protein [Sulfurimonas sp.]
MLKIALFLFILVAMFVKADETINKQDNLGTLSGQIRFYYVFSPSYVKSGRANDYKIDGSAIGGHLKYTSAKFENFGFSTAIYYVRDTKLNDIDDPNTMVAAGRFFTQDYSEKAVLGEANVFYKDKNHQLVLGRQKIDSPLTNSIVTYMPNMFEALSYTNSQFEDSQFSILQLDKMAYGTRSPVEFGLIGEATKTAGATQSGIDKRGEFQSIEQQVMVSSTANTKGVTGFAFTNKSLKNTTIRVWDFYAHDIINMLYIDGIYKNNDANLPYSISGQYLNVQSIGDNLAASWLDASSATMVGLKFAFNYQNIHSYIAYNHSGDAKLLNPFGGDPAYTSSFFSRNAYRANVDAYKLGAIFKVTNNLKIISSHADYGQSTTIGSFVSAKPVQVASAPQGDARESALLFSYNPYKKLNILTGIIYKTSEYYYSSKQVELLDLDFVVTYRF